MDENLNLTGIGLRKYGNSEALSYFSTGNIDVENIVILEKGDFK